MNFPGDSLARFAAGLVAVAALLAARWLGRPRLETRAYALAGILGAAAFLNFGVFHHYHDASFVNTWEQFHYQLGSKYFPELGYDGLYAASIAAQQETDTHQPLASEVRHLPTNRRVATSSYGSFVYQVRQRFTPERWQAFLADHRVYLEHTPRVFWRKIRDDHGYNPSPAWTAVARLFSARLPAGYGSLLFLATLDLLLLAAALTAVQRSFGFRTACLSLALCGLGYGWYYIYLGAFLRLDWLAAAVFGVCLLERGRPLGAGACFGYAAAVRIFPALLLAGPLIVAGRGWLRGERPAWATRLLAGFALALALGGVAGCLAGRGPAAWSEFAGRMRSYQTIWASNLVGLDTLVLTGPRFIRTALTQPHPTIYDDDISIERMRERRAVRLPAKAALLALVVLAMGEASLSGSAVLGIAALFALANPGSYYWILLALVPLRRGRWAALGLLAAQAAMHGVQHRYANGAYAQFWYALQAWFLLLFFATWLLPAALRGPLGRTR